MFDINKRIRNFGDYISYKYPALKRYLKPLYHKIFYNRYYKSRRNSYLKNAKETIAKFDYCMKQNGLEYSLAYGTMLGAVREQGFIKHDADLDVFMWSDSINKGVKESLEKCGFRLTRWMLVENGKYGREESYEYNSVSIDIFYVFPSENGKNYICWFRPLNGYPTLRISMNEAGAIKTLIDFLPFTRNYKNIPFEGLSLPVFSNAEDILVACYGSNYMTPDPHFKPKEIEWKDVKATYHGIGN